MRNLYVSAAAGALIASTLLLPAPAAAQEADTGAQPADQFGEIIVTAQKRSTALQSTPLAISAFSGEMLEDRGINDIANLQSYVPNLHVGAEQDGFKVSLRGIGLQGTTSINDSGVAFYFDNFYISRPAGGSAQFFDIDRIEVLRGPQGTLYGRNATGGVVNVIPKTPTHEYEAKIGATYGSRDLAEGRAVLNVPLGDAVAARMSAVYSREDGYVENTSNLPGTNDFFGARGNWSARGQVLAGAPETLEVLLSGSYASLRSSGVAMTYLERNIGGPPPTQALLATVPPEDPDPLKTNNNAPSSNDVEMQTVSARFTKDFGGAEAVLQVGQLSESSDLFQDFDGSPVDVSRFHKYEDTDATSVEARLLSTGDGPFSWILGAYYYDEDTYIKRIVNLNGLTPGGMISLPNFDLDEWGSSTSEAVFGSATYALAPTFRVTAGGRYTEDSKEGTKRTNLNFGQPLPPDTPSSVTFDKFTWKLGAEWDAAERVLIYASVSTGYKAGGFNVSSDGTPYQPEEITAFEIGEKGEFFDRHVIANVDAFYYDYTDMQLTTLGTYGPSNAPGQFTVNAGGSEIWGVEFDTQWRATHALTLLATYSYINAEFTELTNLDPRPVAPGQPPRNTNLAGNKVPYVAENTVNLGGEYEWDFGNAGALTASLNWNWHSDFYLREFNDPVVDLVDANGKTDFTLTYDVGQTGLTVTGFVTNIEDEVETTNVYVSPGFVGLSATTAYTKPRTIGIRLDYTF